ncbi:two-component system OmpR family sensor kinase [Paraburkholderia bannensis]|uniref:histidine kinase n=1 Tax=Paraburkholderia bannensis TaxID=765414 RepID=A0A7W9WQD9_9BURK|nr:MULTISPECIES: HAMP domain-containing sensor histidine kinase [Paraburkholderia]MBB3257046.1 two-component system OmpR family sensor kinase [Paraburkholderia sp. WP4_3_2]MBB6102000.1 two-component system OmpR family sensor kinase [Paraburkholderia bannensis]
MFFAANSLHRRLSIAIGTLALLVGVLGSLGTFLVVRSLASEFSASLRDAAAHVQAGVSHRAGEPNGIRNASDDLVVQIWSAGDADEPSRTSDPDIALPRAQTGFSSLDFDGETWDVFALAAGDEYIQIAESRSMRNRNALRVAFWSLLPVLALLPLLVLTIAVTVRLSLRPMERVGRRAAKVDLHALKPLEADKAPVELRPFIESINRMIERLSVLVNAERKFIADAAHELRSPISAMQLQIDNLRDAPPDQYRERFEELQRGVARTGSLVSQLLGLARAEIGGAQRAVEDIALTRLVPEVLADMLPLADARGVDLGVERLDEASVRATEGDLRVLIKNLIDNAIRYVHAGGRVDVSVLCDAQKVTIEVIDDGPGIAESDLPYVFDRFFRAAGNDVEGSGLGLAIAQTLAQSYGGRVTLENRGAGQSGIVARIELPQAASATKED